MTQLTTNTFDWYHKQGLVPNGVDIDTATLASCPETRTQLLKLAGIDNFSSL